MMIIIVIVVILQPFTPISHNRMGIMDDGVGQFYAQRNSRMAARPNLPPNGVELRVAYQYMPKPLQTGDEAKLAKVLKENLRLGLAYEANDEKNALRSLGDHLWGEARWFLGRLHQELEMVKLLENLFGIGPWILDLSLKFPEFSQLFLVNPPRAGAWPLAKEKLCRRAWGGDSSAEGLGLLSALRERGLGQGISVENPGPPGQEEHHLHRLGVVEKKQDGWDEGLLTHLIVWNPNLNLGGIWKGETTQIWWFTIIY